jgi:large subunit ribosomal protein L25
MVQFVNIVAELRIETGKGAARAARRAGKIPGVIYGDQKPPVLISIEASTLNRLLRNVGFNTRIYEIVLEGEKHCALARTVQVDPVTDRVIHLDFLRVGELTTISIPVVVRFVNENQSPGLKRGGVLNIVRHEIELVCHAGSIPESIVVDLTGRDIGDSIHISSIKLPEGVRPAILDRDFTVATVAAPSGLRSENVGGTPGIGPGLLPS